MSDHNTGAAAAPRATSVNQETFWNILSGQVLDPVARDIIGAWYAGLPADHVVRHKISPKVLRGLGDLIETQGKRFGLLGQITTENVSDWVEMLADEIDDEREGHGRTGSTPQQSAAPAATSAASARRKAIDVVLARVSNPKVRNLGLEIDNLIKMMKNLEPVFVALDEEAARIIEAAEAARAKEHQAQPADVKKPEPFGWKELKRELRKVKRSMQPVAQDVAKHLAGTSDWLGTTYLANRSKNFWDGIANGYWWLITLPLRPLKPNNRAGAMDDLVKRLEAQRKKGI